MVFLPQFARLAGSEARNDYLRMLGVEELDSNVKITVP